MTRIATTSITADQFASDGSICRRSVIAVANAAMSGATSKTAANSSSGEYPGIPGAARRAAAGMFDLKPVLRRPRPCPATSRVCFTAGAGRTLLPPTTGEGLEVQM